MLTSDIVQIVHIYIVLYCSDIYSVQILLDLRNNSSVVLSTCTFLAFAGCFAFILWCLALLTSQFFSIV